MKALRKSKSPCPKQAEELWPCHTRDVCGDAAVPGCSLLVAKPRAAASRALGTSPAPRALGSASLPSSRSQAQPATHAKVFLAQGCGEKNPQECQSHGQPPKRERAAFDGGEYALEKGLDPCLEAALRSTRSPPQTHTRCLEDLSTKQSAGNMLSSTSSLSFLAIE